MTKPSAIKTQDHDEDAEFKKDVEEGIDSLNSGRRISYEKIRRWLLSWGTENELPPPK